MKTFGCLGKDEDEFRLEPFIVDVGLDTDAKKLKFFMNTEVLNPYDYTSNDVVISDVNQTTNKYTSMHVEILFMGKRFVDTYLRFCDMVAVKNTTGFQNGPRYSTVHGGKAFPHWKAHPHDRPRPNKRDSQYDYSQVQDVTMPSSLAYTNDTIENIFNNSTGELVLCPLYSNDSLMLYYEADVGEHIDDLGSYTIQFTVISNDHDATTIGCCKTYVTPIQSSLILSLIDIGILALLLVAGLVNFIIVISSSYQESSNPFLFTASTICNEKLLKQLDASVQDIIIYLQFALFIGGLDIQYPGFYQPLIGNMRWCALMGISLFLNGNYAYNFDNIYVTFRIGGLKSLADFTSSQSVGLLWPNFMAVMGVGTAVLIIITQTFLFFKYLFDMIRRIKGRKEKKKCMVSGSTASNASTFDYKFTIPRNIYYTFGLILNQYYALFCFPFLILTLFTFYNACVFNGRKHQYPELKSIEKDLFSTTIPYKNLLSPVKYFIHQERLAYDGVDNSTLSGDQGAPLNGTSIETVSSPKGALLVPLHIVVLSAILFTVWITIGLGFLFNYIFSFKKWKIIISKNISSLYTSIRTILLWAFFYHHYHPDKVYYIGIDFSISVLKLIVIGLFQAHGQTQVICLVIIEFVNTVLLFLIWPYYVKWSWRTSKWMLPVFRLITTILCIPYLRSLNLSEASRTYVAYVQLALHLFVAFIFIFQLFYGLVITLLSNRQRLKDDDMKSLAKPNTNTSYEEFNSQFDYIALRPPSPIANDDTKLSRKGSSNNSFENDIPEDYYYRGNRFESEKEDGRSDALSYVSYNNKQQESNDNDTNEKGILIESTDDLLSFQREQLTSDIRKRKNDYTFREGDLIYRKYFVNDSIDPEVKALWDARQSRNVALERRRAAQKGSGAQKARPNQKQDEQYWGIGAIFGYLNYIKGFLLSPEEPERKFEVSRPRQLVVKNLDDVQIDNEHLD